MMNADASPGVALHGDLGAKFPPLPWLAAGLLLAGAALAGLASWLLVRGIRGKRLPAELVIEQPQASQSIEAPVGAHS